MNAIQAFWADTPILQLSFDVLSVVVPTALLLAFAGMGFFSASALVLSKTRKRASYEKCARQLAFLGAILGWVLLVGGRLWLFFTDGGGYAPESVLGFLLEISWMLLAAAALMSSIYFALWRGLSGLPVLHVTLGVLSGIQACVAAVTSLAAARFFAALASPNAATLTLGQIFMPNWDSPVWSALCYSIPLIFALPAGFGALWLILRRKYDDFGRDHYNTMLPWCAAWARNAWGLFWLLLLVSTAIQVYTDHQTQAFIAEDGLVQSLRLLLWLIPALLWAITSRSANPLRHKASLTLALFVALSFMLPFYLEVTAF